MKGRGYTRFNTSVTGRRGLWGHLSGSALPMDNENNQAQRKTRSRLPADRTATTYSMTTDRPQTSAAHSMAW